MVHTKKLRDYDEHMRQEAIENFMDLHGIVHMEVAIAIMEAADIPSIRMVFKPVDMLTYPKV